MSRLQLLALVVAVAFVGHVYGIPPTQKPCDTRRTKNNRCCVFPFRYKGQLKYDCGKYDSNKEWCATTGDYDAAPGEWGVCSGAAPPSIFDQILETNEKAASSRRSAGVELFQGDIMLTDDLKYNVYTFMHSRGINTPWDKRPPTDPARRAGSRNKRAVMRYESMRWMNGNRGEVPYEITSSNYNQRSVILQALRHWEQKVPCLKFVDRRRAPGKKYLSFFAGGGCYSMVGRQRGSGAQKISIGRGCGTLGVIAHEIGHALGFWHEQSRPDRDRYVRINWSNIQSGMSFNFQKYDTNKINSRGISYDYSSIMHYGSTAFANRRGVKTIVGVDGRTNLGQRYGLSAKDVQQANLLYCKSAPPKPPTAGPRPPTPPPPSGCRYTDNHRWCPYWKKRGYCVSSSPYSTYMSNNCRTSCNCNDKVCKDAFSVCRTWSSLGHCNSPRFGTYVKTFCKKSCRVCT